MPRTRKATTEGQTDGVQGQTQERRTQTKSVKMRREDGKTADVHPDMVDHYRKGGFEVVQ